MSVVPVQAELTTQQAADMLNVSELAFDKTGTHPRVRFGDLLALEHRERDARHRALDEVAQQGQKLGMGY